MTLRTTHFCAWHYKKKTIQLKTTSLGSFIRHASIALVHLQALLGLIAPTRFYRTLRKSLNDQSVRQQWFGESFSKSRFRTTIISIGMIFLIDLAIALPLFNETQTKTSVCMFSGFLGRSKCCLVELDLKRHRLHFKKAWCAQDRICETHIFFNRWVFGIWLLAQQIICLSYECSRRIEKRHPTMLGNGERSPPAFPNSCSGSSLNER